MARIDIDQIEKVEKDINIQDVAKTTYTVGQTDEGSILFQIDTLIEASGGQYTQSLQLDADNLSKLLKLLSSQFQSFSIPLLDDQGEVKYGLNWGNRAGRNINQAYLDLPKEIYNSDFFPTNGIDIHIRTDDNQNIKFTRAQKDNVNGHALQTPDDNTIIGIYLRNRLSIKPGDVITKEAIEEYGRNFITISRVGDFYYLDFSSSKRQREKPSNSVSLQQIFYGAPGTGKSHEVKKITGELDGDKPNVFRTTFHPDTDYASFVGCYKPIMKPVPDKYQAVAGRDEDIAYEFVPQAFTDAYVYAYNHEDEPTYLVIEEINRGNCAQIFGDLFQLLDRNENGISDYKIKADKDLAKYLKDGNDEEGNAILANKAGIKDGKLCLPSNLYILATMNTSDQSLFPIDSAFKRRWNWEYVAIDYNESKSSEFTITIGASTFKWVDFIMEVNQRIFDLTQSEDKQMGNFFIKSSIDQKQFCSKVMFYLWNEVLKDEVENSKYFFCEDRGNSQTAKFTFTDIYGGRATDVLKNFMKHLKVADQNAQQAPNAEPQTEGEA